MNSLKKTGAVLIAGAFFIGSCSAEQTPDTSQNPAITHESVDTQVAPSASATLPTFETSAQPDTSYENRQRMSAILGQACTYVVEQGNKVTEGFPDVWSPQSPLRGYSEEYEKLVQVPQEPTHSVFDVALRQTCDSYAAIFSKNNG